MRVSAISDTHLNPGDTLQPVLGDGRKVGVGDILNILPWGKDAWKTPEGKATVHSVALALDDYVIGNHEGRKSWVKELFKGYDINIVNRLDIGNYTFIHGHQFTEWRILAWGADDLVYFLTGWNGYLRAWWYNFCRERNWMPSLARKDKIIKVTDYGEEVTEYDWMVNLYWDIAQKWALAKERNLVIGHSHKRNDRNEMGHKVIDLGARNRVEVII